MSPEQAEKAFWANSFILLVGELARDFFIFALSLTGLICFDFWGFACSGGLILLSEILSINNLKKMIYFDFEMAEGRETPEPSVSDLPQICTYAALTVLFISFLAVYL